MNSGTESLVAQMHWADWLVVVAYAVGVPALGFKLAKRSENAEDYFLAGRRLTLPAFVMTLVTTWYGGILGISEYSYRYGLANWFVFGLPYYVAALLFAAFLAKRARQTSFINLPDQLFAAYGPRVARAGAFVVFVATLPASYVLMVGVLVGMLFGWPLPISVIVGTLVSVIYVHRGGFRAVLKNDFVQFTLMFTGFMALVAVLWFKAGPLWSIWDRLPATHREVTGGQSWGDIAVWYFIALATLIEPAFYQRCYAAQDRATARNGILVSVCFWLLFDLLTTTAGLYAAALYQHLANPVAAFPQLAIDYLPAGLLGYFWVTMFAVVMSTVESYLFVAAITGGRDLWLGDARRNSDAGLVASRRAVWVVAVLAVVLALFFQSVVGLWYIVGSVSTPALLLPVLSTFTSNYRFSERAALLNIVLAGGVALAWEIVRGMGILQLPFSIPGIYVGLATSLVIWGFGRNRIPSAIPGRSLLE